jgi:hypothetical protein
LASAEPTEGVTSAVHVENGTSLVVFVFINDHRVAVVPPTTHGVVVDAAQVSIPPWLVETRTSGGRVLGTLTIPVTTVDYGLRLDLSCGRIDVWFGAPLAGGFPGPGTPGDCTP